MLAWQKQLAQDYSARSLAECGQRLAAAAARLGAWLFASGRQCSGTEPSAWVVEPVDVARLRQYLRLAADVWLFRRPAAEGFTELHEEFQTLKNASLEALWTGVANRAALARFSAGQRRYQRLANLLDELLRGVRQSVPQRGRRRLTLN